MEDKYHMLSPLEFIEYSKHHKAIWKFKCDCGKEKICVLADVKSGRTKSCGCLQKLNGVMNGFLRTIILEGKKFEEFEVLKRNLDKSFSHYYGAYYICKCKCGEIFERKGTYILTGRCKRCTKCQYIYNGNFRKRQLA